MPNSSENEEERIVFDNEGKVPELNSPDSINDDVLVPLENFKSPRRLTTAERSKTNPSPYYYSDLLKKKHTEEERKQLFQFQHPRTASNTIKETDIGLRSEAKKTGSLENQPTEKDSVSNPKRYSITEEGVRIIRCDSPSSTTSDDSDCSECQKRREWHSHALAVVRAATQNLRSQSAQKYVDDVEPEVYYQNTIVSQMPQSRFIDNQALCACATPNFAGDDDQLFQPRSIFYVHQQGYQECADCSITDDERLKALIFDEMNVRQRKIYETAFDSKIAKSDDDLDDVDRITNHSASLFGNEYRMVTSQSKESFIASSPGVQHPKEKRYRSKHNKKAQQQQNNNNNNIINNNSKSEEDIIAKDIENIKIEESIDNIVNANVTSASTTTANTQQYTPSPPSTAPLPLKFPNTKHEKFFINSIKSAPNLPASNALQHPRLKDLRGSEKSDSSKERPRSVIIEAGRVFELKRSHSGRHYSSSIESMATSSSGSMESIRSSTSEGNRSTTSTESRHSSTLSSHSSDSGANVARPLRVPVLIHPKLQILSPISDKSTQEPVSEENKTPKLTPGEADGSGDNNLDDNTDIKQKKRPTSNKIMLIAREEIQGSDSGISLHSRDEKAKLSALCDNKIDNATGLPQDLKDLPFDMPKLRRRRVQPQVSN